ncbi:MAG: hypothetical protein V4463_08460 [Pseudomonadota bacterium]
MPLIDTLAHLLSRASRALGFETADSFPPGHVYARTHWNKAYFDIASDVKPDEIERRLCESITNTPHIFAHITHPTPRMQRALIAVIDMRARRSCGNPDELLALLIHAYHSRHTLEAVPGLRALIEQTVHDDKSWRMQAVMEHLARQQLTIDAV